MNHSKEILLAALILVLVFAGGLLIFSWLNLVIYRLPAGEKLLQKKNKQEKLPKRGLFIMLLGGILAVAVVCWYHFTPAALTIFLLYCVLTVITFIDADTQEIPPVLNLIILLLGILSVFTMPGLTILERIIGFFCISLPLRLLIIAIPDGFGGGDIKMMAAAGFFLGWKATLVAFFIGVVLGGAYGAYLLIAKKADKKAHFAFGPFLCIGIMISAYAGIGVTLMNHYLEPFQVMLRQMQ